MAKAIFIAADCWLCVFDLLPPSQLGLGISMISHRFDFYVDEHFKTRKWTLKFMQIWRKIGENGTKEMEIVNCYRKPMPIPQNPLPKRVVGFERINIFYIDNNVITFLHRFHQLFTSFCPINLAINTHKDRIAQFLLRNIWPIFGKNLHGIELSATVLRQFVDSSILNNCPSLRFVSLSVNFYGEFPCDDSANASSVQAVTKWLFTPRPDNVPKVFNCYLDKDYENLASKIEAFTTAFANASSPVNFIVVIWFPSYFADFDLAFDLTNELTREQLALKRTDNSDRFLLIRCPIARDESKWTKWEEEAIEWEIDEQWNRIDILINNEDQIGDGLLDATPGPSDQKK